MSDLPLALAAAAIGAAIAGGVTARRFRRASAGAERRYDRARDEHAASERAATERSDLQATVLDAMEEGVLLLRHDGAVLFSNVALVRHLGAVPTSAETVRPLDLQRCIQVCAETGEITRAEVEIGSPARWLRATALPTGQDEAILLVVHDITESRRLVATRRDFVANASHELKTPLASIRAAAETLRTGGLEDPPAARRFAEQIERESIRLSRIVADLLDLSRLEAASGASEDVHLDEIVTDEIERLEAGAVERGVDIRVETEPTPVVTGSSRDLALLARNLIDNAIRYTQPGGSVDVEVRAESADVILRVSDTGVGIPQRDLPRIFERFYRVDQARSRDTGGTGLGLAIVKHVAENHGGEVTVSSELGRGSTFEVRLPAATTSTT
jgi:signal transduction histidine kinase